MSELELLTTREFDAPIALVFDVFTKLQHVRQWFAPFEEESDRLLDPPACRRELPHRHGDRRHGIEFRGTYLEVEPPTQTVETWLYDEWPDAEAVESMDLHETDG